MKNIEVSKIVVPISTSDGAGVKLKRSIGTQYNFICIIWELILI